jgi:prepilin-type processing-associated H-X9-DG protein
MQAYHDKNGCYPPAYTTDKDGKPMHSWRVLLLPYLGQQALYNQYDMNEPWNGPHNRHLANRMPEVYRCPGETPASKNLTNYAMLVGSNAFGRPNKGRTKVQNANLPVMKIAIAETTGSGIEWLEPRDLDVDGMSFDLTAKDGQEMSSNHSGLVNVLYTDGTTQTLSEFEDSNTIKSQALFDNETPAEKKDDATDE